MNKKMLVRQKFENGCDKTDQINGLRSFSSKPVLNGRNIGNRWGVGNVFRSKIHWLWLKFNFAINTSGQVLFANDSTSRIHCNRKGYHIKSISENNYREKKIWRTVWVNALKATGNIENRNASVAIGRGTVTNLNETFLRMSTVFKVGQMSLDWDGASQFEQHTNAKFRK